jgi:hypothetical protein
MLVIKYSALILIVFGVFVSLSLFITSYDDFIIIVSDLIGTTGKEEKLREILSETKYFMISFAPLIITVIGFIVLLSQRKVYYFLVGIKEILSSIVKQIKEIEAKNLLVITLIFFIVLIIRLFYVTSLPISYDEAWTYINFTEKGVLSSISYYPAPNNHILYSLLTNLTHNLPFNNTINLRLPSLLVGLFSTVLFYLTFRKFFKEHISLGLTFIFSFLYPVIYYGYEARGYSLIILSFIIIFYTSLRILELHEQRIRSIGRYWFYLTFGSILGLYSVPSFAYPYFLVITFLGLFFLWQREYKYLVELFISAVTTSIITIILYFPILIVSGIDSLANNRFVRPMPRVEVLENLYSHFTETFQYFFYFNWSLLFFICLTIFLFFKKIGGIKRNLALYIIYFSPLILLTHSVIPFSRTWVYLVVPILFLFGLLLNEVSAKKLKIYLWPVVIPIVFLLGFSFDRSVRVDEKFSFEARNLSSFLISNNAKKIYVNHRLIEVYLIYYFNEMGVPIDVVYSRLNPLNDNIIKSNNFDYLILDNKFDVVSNYVFLKKMCTKCSTHGEDVHIYTNLISKKNRELL